MIRQLLEHDKDIINDYLSKNPLLSLFFSANINDYGIKGDIFNMWGLFENQNINCLIGKFHNVLMIYSNSDIINCKYIIDYLDKNNISFSTLQCEAKLAVQFENIIKFSKIHKNYLCELKKENFKPVNYNDINPIKADESHIYDIISLIDTIEEFKGLNDDHNAMKTLINYGYTYLIYKNSELISIAACNSKNKYIANIGLVCTSKNYRNKSYASKLLSFVCNEIFKYSNSCRLCYDNPEAGKIYNKIGFIEKDNIHLCIK